MYQNLARQNGEHPNIHKDALKGPNQFASKWFSLEKCWKALPFGQFNMVHLKIIPWKFGDSELSYWKPSCSGSMLNFRGVNGSPHDSPFPNLVPRSGKTVRPWNFFSMPFGGATFFRPKARVFFFGDQTSNKLYMVPISHRIHVCFEFTYMDGWYTVYRSLIIPWILWKN